MALQTTQTTITTDNAGLCPTPRRLTKEQVSTPQTCHDCTWLEALESGGVAWCGRFGQFRHIATPRVCGERRLADCNS